MARGRGFKFLHPFSSHQSETEKGTRHPEGRGCSTPYQWGLFADHRGYGPSQDPVARYDTLPARPLNGKKQGDSSRGTSRQTDSARAHEQVPVWPAGIWPPQQPLFWGPPPIQASFDGSSNRVALFLSQVISHFDLYGRFYPSQWSMVVAVTTVLTGEMVDWVANLHREHARELTNVGMFLEGLRGRFEDETRTQAAEGEIVSIKQRGRSAKEYVKEFKKFAGRLRAWPERLLIHQFLFFFFL